MIRMILDGAVFFIAFFWLHMLMYIIIRGELRKKEEYRKIKENTNEETVEEELLSCPIYTRN